MLIFWHRRIITLSSLLFGLLFTSVHTHASDIQTSDIQIGVLAHRGNDFALNMWTPTAHYLSQVIPNHTFHIVPLTNDTIQAAINQHHTDFIITNPASYATLEAQFGITRIATLRNRINLQIHTEFGAVILTRANRHDIQSLQDLKDKTFMAVHPNAFGGWWMAWREFKDAGISPSTDFTDLTFSDFPQDKVVHAVLNGYIDAGTVRTGLLEHMHDEGLINLHDFKIINPLKSADFPFLRSTRLYPEWPIAILKQTPQNLAQQVVIALLQLAPTTPAATAANSAGWTVPLDYQTVHELMQQLHVGPYTYLDRVDLKQVVQQYGYWLILAIIGIFAMSGSTLHVAQLNRKFRQTNTRLATEITERKRAEDKSSRLGRILDQSFNEIYIFDAETLHFIQVNDGARHNLGYTMTELQKMTPLDLMPDISHSQFETLLIPLREHAKKNIVLETDYQRITNERYHVEMRLQLSHQDSRSVFIAINQDITEQRQAEQKLTQERQRAQITLESIGDAVITTDIAGNIEYFNPIAEQLTGFLLNEVKNTPLLQVIRLVDEQTQEPVEDPIVRCLRAGRFVNFDAHNLLINRDGGATAVQETVTPRYNSNGEIAGVVLVFRDITELRLLERRMEYHATHDALTGLINRREFENQLNLAIKSARKKSLQHALLYLDLDNFKVVNDTCGHNAGDELIKSLTNEISKTIKNNDTLARLGGDEFGVLLHNCTLVEATPTAERIRQAINDFQFIWEDRLFEVGVSIGVAEITLETNRIEDLLSAADSACYVAKDSGRNRIYQYREDDATLIKRHGEMNFVHRIKRALEEHRFHLYAQPIISIQTPVNPTAHLEILLRMEDEMGEILAAGEFIPAAERYQLMPRIDQWVIKNTFDFISQCDKNKTNDTIFAINLSGQSVSTDDFLEFVVDQIRYYAINTQSICFEITETTAIANFGKAVRLISILSNMGCQFALDDFGSGLSSFSYLKQLPVHYLKIDGSFVKNIATDKTDFAMVEAINTLGHIMNMKTIAEFVENEDTLIKLQELGVDYAQGISLAQPQLLKNYFEIAAPTRYQQRSTNSSS